MEKSGSRKRSRETNDEVSESKKRNIDDSPGDHPLEDLLNRLDNLQLLAGLTQNPDFADKNLDADVRNEMLNLGEELDRLELGLAASKTASYESILELSSWQIAEMLRNAGAKGPKHDDGINLFDLIDKPHHEVEEEAAAKAEKDWEDLENEFDECFAPRDYPTRLFFKEFDMQGRRELPEPSPTENGAENGDDEIDGRSSTDRNFVRANGEWVHIDDFLGEKWERRAYRIHNIPLPDLPPIRGLKTDLREWEFFGVKKMLNSIHEFNGCILGDEMGMGKTLVCIVTALLYRQEHPSSNFTLVVTPKSCIRGWKKQLEVHFYEGEGPKTFVLEDTKTTAEDLVKMNPDFVLVTWGFLKSRFTVYDIGRIFTKLRHQRGLRWLLAKYSRYLPADGLPPRENNVLHSELYEYLGKSPGICFLDEAQIVKNQNTLAHKAVRSLPFSIKIPVTGSMVHNTWADAGGIINQLSLGMFNNVKHFQNAFSVAGAKRHGKLSYEMEPSRKNHLLRLLLALTVSRPASLLHLPGREEHVDDFTIPDSASVEIALLVKKFLKVCHMPKTDSEVSAIFHMFTAQKWASNQLLLQPLKPLKPTKHKEDAEFGIENDETQDSEASYESEDPQTSDDEDDEDDDSEYLSGEEHQASDIEQSDSQSADLPEMSEASASRVDVLMHEDGETDVLTEKEHVVWNRILNNASDEEILSPRVFTVVQRLKKIIEDYPGEKIVVFSTYVRFLDIVGVAIQRDSDIHFQALRFDGSLDREERDRRATAFDEDRDLPVMMVSKGAGSVGMDFSVASHIIQCENWWNGNDELQAHFRCWRGGQTKTVRLRLWRGACC